MPGIRFEITARRGDAARTFVLQSVDIDSAAMDAVKAVADDEVVVQVREYGYDPADHVYDDARRALESAPSVKVRQFGSDRTKQKGIG